MGIPVLLFTSYIFASLSSQADQLGNTYSVQLYLFVKTSHPAIEQIYHKPPEMSISAPKSFLFSVLIFFSIFSFSP